MTWQQEFPDFTAIDMPALPQGFEDTSWHNDACPSFTHPKLHLLIYIDYADSEMRELDDFKRFTINGLDNKNQVCDGGNELLHTDNWDDVLEFVHNFEARDICYKWVRRFGWGFHPDTRGEDYTPPLSARIVKQYDTDMERLFQIASDPYAVAVDMAEHVVGKP